MFSDNPITEFSGPWGVPIQIGASIVLLPLVFLSFGGTPDVLFYDVIFLALLIGSIFLHELGHAWGCLVQGIPVRRIMLYGGGGFCEPSRSATAYQDELIVAMGPIVNLTLWAVSSLLVGAVANEQLAWILYDLAYINLFLAVLNLIPVLPLDGGRLFHLALLRVLPSDAAMRIAGGVGLFVALIWVPMMLGSYVFFGLVLFFWPSIRLHWMLMRGVPV